MSTNQLDREAGALLRPVETQRASEAIYEQIKGLIISGQFKPGDRLPSERNMMEMLQRSRPTIREALRLLERAGFIRIVPGTNGAIAQELGTDGVEQSLELVLQTSKVTLEELVEYRRVNDTSVARWAAQRHTQEDLAKLMASLDRAEQMIDEGDFQGFMRLDVSFHTALAQAGGNTVACILSSVLSRMVEPMLLRNLQDRTSQENMDMCRKILSMHRRIYEAVRLGDVAAAEDAMARHIIAFGDDLRK